MEKMIQMTHEEDKRARVISKVLAGKLSQIEAAQELGLSVRHFRRLQKNYELRGVKSLTSKKRGKEGNNKSCPLKNAKIIARIQERYSDFGPTLASEKLCEEDGFSVSKSHVRKLMIEKELWNPRKRNEKKIHLRRERRPRYGELQQLDGSHHPWFEDRAEKCCLIVIIDDATSYIGELFFSPSESTLSYFQAMENYIAKYGKPLALYSDKHGVFRVNHGANLEERTTQFGRAMQELEIKSICAHSPQAKGRVERANKTLQDRLVKEMRLQGISSIEDANKFAEEFRKKHNAKFAVPPVNPDNAHVSLNSTEDLKLILSIHDTRVVSKDLSFQFDNIHYQIELSGFRSRQIVGEKVLIITNHKSASRVFYNDMELKFTEMKFVRNRPVSCDEKNLNAEAERWLKSKNQKKKG